MKNDHFFEYVWNLFQASKIMGHGPRQFIATGIPPGTVTPKKVVKSKGILPKMAETFRLRIHNMGVSENSGFSPQIIHFNIGVFHYI